MLLTAVSVFAADATSEAGSLAVAVLAVDDASAGVKLSTLGQQLGGGAGSRHGESKEEDDGGEDVDGLHIGGGWLLEVDTRVE